MPCGSVHLRPGDPQYPPQHPFKHVPFFLTILLVRSVPVPIHSCAVAQAALAEPRGPSDHPLPDCVPHRILRIRHQSSQIRIRKGLHVP